MRSGSPGSPAPRGGGGGRSDDDRDGNRDSLSDEAAGKPRRSLPLGRSPPPGSYAWGSRSASPRRSGSYSGGNSPVRGRGKQSPPRDSYRGRRSPPPGRRGPPQDAQQNDLRTVYVGGLPPVTKEDDCVEFFEKFGKVVGVKLIYHHDTQEFRGFGFVTFDSQRSAEDAAESGREGLEILGNRIKVNLAKYNRPPGRQQYQQRDAPRDGPRDFRRFSHEGMDGGPPPGWVPMRNGPPPHGMYPPRMAPPHFMYPPRGPPPRSPPPRSDTSPRHPPPRYPPHASDAEHPAKRRRRSPSPAARSDGAPGGSDRKTTEELEKVRADLQRVRTERSQAQQENVQLQQQLQELTEQANAKLHEQRMKIKIAKKRSQQRGKQMLGLVEAAKNVQSCQETVRESEKALEVAKAQLFACLADSEEYINRERAEDESAERERRPRSGNEAHEGPAHASAEASLRGNASLSNGERENQNGNAGSLQNQAGLALKPFKISLEQS